MLSRSSSPSSSTTDALEPLSPRPQVGGLPLHELNQLELQFLLLNDFRLKIPTDELQRYADQLILYWVGRNGTSNPAAAAAGRSRAASRARTPPREEAVDGEPSEAVETPPLTRSAVAAAQAQAQSPHRPRSIRSHPSTSSSFSSSTVTPGTPSTTRADDDDEEEEDDGWGDEDEDADEDGAFEGKERGRDGRATARDGSRSRSRARARGRTGSWGVAAGEPMQED